LQRAIPLSIHLKTLLVNRAVMPAAQHRQVRQSCRAAVCPVVKVMSLPER
jgi:hypothetical protein